MSTKERLPTNNTADVESPFLGDELFAVEPKEEWELRTAALAEETPYVGSEVLSGFEADRESSDASTMSPLRTTGTAGGRNFTVNDGTVLTPRLEIFAHDLSAAFERRTGKQIHVTSGVRTPEAQARAMWTKLVANEDLNKLYRNKTAVNEVIAAAKGQPEVVAIPAMVAILTAQMARGVYLSGHMRANSIDVRSKTMSEAEKRACEAAVAELGARWLYEGVPPHFHVDMPPAVAAQEAPSYRAVGRDTWRGSDTEVEREDECLLGNPDDRETFETAEDVEDTETMHGLLDVGEAPPFVPPGLNMYQLNSGEPTVTLPDGSTLFNNAGTLLWTPREAKVIGLSEPIIIMPDGQGQAVLWPAIVPAPKSAKPIEVGPMTVFMQAQFFNLKVKCTSDKKQCRLSWVEKLSEKVLEFAVSETGEAKVTASVELPVYQTPVYVGFAGSLDSRAQVKGQAQVGVKGGKGPIKVKGGVEVMVRVDPAQLMVVVGEKALSLRNAIKQGIRVAKWDPIIEPIRAVFGHEMCTSDPSVLGHEYETGSSSPVRGSNAFGTVFQNDSTGPSNVNAYLLAYLATLVYADRIGLLLPESADWYKPSTAVLELRNRFEANLQTNPQAFKEKFEKVTSPLFYSRDRPESPTNVRPKFEFVWGNLGGFDPEAMLVETATSVFVVFRGTDRVGSFKPGESGYEWDEWITTDAKVKLLPLEREGLWGSVHTGAWSSLSGIKKKLVEGIKNFHGQTKKVWITGHSLGAAQAQLFAAYLSATSGINQIAVQGVYAFASPRVGDASFAKGLNSRFKGRLQRFEFVDDPITLLPPLKFGPLLPRILKLTPPYPEYAHAGVRNYFDTIWKYKPDAGERDAADDIIGLAFLATILEVAKEKFAAMTPQEKLELAAMVAKGAARTAVAAALAGPAGTVALAGGATLTGAAAVALKGVLSTACFHQPTWYLRAAYAQLTTSEKEQVPFYLPIPSTESGACGSEACGAHEIARAQGAPGMTAVLRPRQSYHRG